MKEKIKNVLEKMPGWVKAVVASAVIVAIAVVVDGVVQRSIHRDITEIQNDDFSHVFQIDSIVERDGKLELNGWVFKHNEDAAENDFDIVLYDYVNDEAYYPDIKDAVRNDVNEYFACEYDYSESGFVAVIKTKKLDLRNVNYEVLIQEKNSRKAMSTGIYISKGELMYVKPEEYVMLDVVGTELEAIVNNGNLRVHRSDVGMYVYQYEGRMYWIADVNYGFEQDKSTMIECQLSTTQVDKLPQSRLENNLLWDNIQFYFEKRELTDINTGKYRVAELEIPVQYSINKMWTGYYTSDWVWVQYFRPIYEFN